MTAREAREITDEVLNERESMLPLYSMISAFANMGHHSVALDKGVTSKQICELESKGYTVITKDVIYPIVYW